ncbi:protocadherin Fat 4-like isoform X2 [Dendronephthya gigantea]|uniref:protocadherin Fat 4-like isoform X2 n=1 Tax=Dendronephthya gigantea TaxID=151771 RepID=UPI00106A4B76|nr:protocadherin Fat 4-like isoform X2 [Dendronephthya gigantea]
MLWYKIFLYLSVLFLATTVDGLDFADGTKFLTIKEEQNTQTWPVENTDLPGNLTYTLEKDDSDEGGDTYKKFIIVQDGPTRAELQLNYTYDFEKEDPKKSKTFKIVSTPVTGPKGELKISITLVDINDHTPEFTNLPHTVVVSEVLGVGSILYKITATDGDGTDTYNYVAFSITDGNIGNKFALEPFQSQGSVNLKLSSRLDFDEGPEVYNLTINVTDWTTAISRDEARSTLSYLIINVTDVDDLPAIFTQNVYEKTISENLATGSFVIKVTAVDKDKTMKGVVKYGLVEETNPGGMFAIDETTGNITLVGSLNRKTQSFYALLVSANSTYHDPMHAQVLILIEDANVHSPNFTANVYTAEVSENAVKDTLVLVVQANDFDEGTNAEVSYSIEGDEATAFYVTTVNHLGYIFVNASLDYDAKKIYNFTVRATEIHTVEKFNDSATIIVEVTEVLANENNPKFNESSYSVNVTENSLPGRVIQVAATDADEANFGSITYSIIDGSQGMFTIDNQTGWINTTSQLNREDRDNYILIVRATDGEIFARHTDVLVIITVLDTNDHTPTFLAGSYTGYVVENSNIGDTILAVEARDLDEGTNAVFDFSLVGADGKFSVVSDGNLGYITVNGSLDFEMNKNFTFLVIAKETSTSEKRENNVSVTISLIDVNDNSPVFSPVTGYSVEVAENSANGTSVLNVSASDLDSGAYGQITFSLITTSVPFSVDQNTGEILIAGSLDREAKDYYDLTIEAKDGGQPSLSNYVHVIVNITDVNDEAPMFLQSSYTINIDENTKIGSNILTATATDNDHGTNSKLLYYIEGGNGLFKVDSNGMISVNGSLDYETNTSLSFTLFAQESSTSEKWKANCTINVVLSDVNEYDPKFTKDSYYALIEENKPAGSEIVKVKASDQDGYFRTISYTILSGNDDGYFTINHTSGDVTTTGPVDKETTDDNFVLKIQASDNGNPNRTTETFLVIEILDSNDHSPIFTKSWYNTTIPENLPLGTILLTVKATDLDTNATNAVLRYFVSNSDGKFDVHPSTGQVYVNATLDYESKSTYMFTIFAEESQTQMMQQHNATVHITLTDTNEFDPVFTNSSFSGNTSEDSVVGASVVQIVASDQDGYFNQITYSIVPGDDSSSFTINSTTGIITTAAQLDYEKQNKFILTVRAKDNGSPGRTSEVTVVIDVLDANDNQPVFSQSDYNSTIPENVPVGTTVLTVEAEEKDSGANAEFKYHIIGGDNKFEITDDGVIFTKALLDFETKTWYQFLVVANETNSVQGAKPNATVTVVLQDVNEFNPVFSQAQYTANVSENSPVWTSVIKVSATDSDGYYNQTTYSIISGGNGKFEINSTTGEITTNSTLDRETESQFILTVRAQDNGENPARTAEVVVVITVLDISDHGPKFLQKSYNASIFENVDKGTTILTVEATDSDLGSNAVIAYSIVGGDGKFRVDASGNIISNCTFDYETKMTYEFQIVANEAQTATGYTDTSNVTVVIQDVNEFNPKFLKPSYTALVNESSSVGTHVVKVTATDDDGSENVIRYSIIQGNVDNLFAINSSTGWIQTADVLDGSNVDQYTLTVRAEDSGDSPRTAEILVIITISEKMRNASFLLQEVYNVTVLENALDDSVVVKLNLRYSYDDVVSAFSFSIAGGDGYFDVNQKGEVRVANALDYESKMFYTFTIIVTEIQPASGLVANATINVKVEDVNEFNPQFEQNLYRANVSEDASLETHVTKVFANDSDGDYNVITYAIINGNHDNSFIINSTTGAITTAKPLDRETQSQFVLTVRASDNGPSARTSEVVVIVDVLEISEHPPVFLMSNYTGVVYENSAVGTIVLVVGTRDRDTTSSGVVYSLVGANGRFAVNSEGIIYVNGSLDYESDERFTFLVVAEEEAPYSHLRHNATVTVNLKDVNEYNPVFNQTVYSSSVKENDVFGIPVLRVFATDNDRNINVLKYSIISGNDQGNFSINSSTGEITVAKTLDRESANQIILTVRAEDNGLPPRTSEVTVVIGIIDTNDLGPKFLVPQYNATVSEDANVGTHVVVVQGVDMDATPDMLGYELVGVDAFKVMTQYGLGFIVVNQDLDYEQTKSYNFMVYAVEKTPEKRNTSCWVKVSVIDANDNHPVFVNSSYSAEVLEQTAVGTTVLNVSATDADSEIFGPINYAIIDGNILGHFNIDNTTGRIFTSGVLDRENHPQYFLVVEARDNGSPALTETVTVSITVLDSNDVRPQFIAAPYSASVPENSAVNTSILTVQAVDMDKGQNGEISYELVGADGLFRIEQDGDFGSIKVAGDLDYERNKTFTFYVVAKETQTSEKRETNTTVVITILDVNDNPPVFKKSVYEASVGEFATSPHPVGTVSATDEDSGEFGEITYMIIHDDDNGNFTINNKTGEVLTGAILNREVKDRYVLTIQALDGGSPPRKAVTTMIVRVTDQNEQPPYFENTPYKTNIVENKEYDNSVIYQVEATDLDLMPVTYKLESHPNFSIDATSGIISATGNFDREKQSVFNLTVTAIDQGGLNVSEHFIISVEDTNDNYPQFLDTPYMTIIPDNTSVGVEILKVKAIDLDEAHNAEIIFSLLNAEGKFTINQTTGMISVSGKLDSQEKRLYTLKVIATDRGIPQAKINSTTVTVNLTDYSNHPPEFTNVAWVGTISEGAGPSFVLNVQAKDPDSGILGKIEYTIIDGNTNNSFTINATGAILSTGTLDYENDTQKTFDLTVMVEDKGGLKDTTQVRITVLDVNDNPPKIINLPAPAELNISDNLPQGTLLYVLQGQDLDSGKNGEFEFFGAAVPDNLTIDRNIGLIMAKRKLESTSSSSILFTGYVRDKGTPSQSSANYTIKFNIIPDPISAPFFLSSTLTEIKVFENASIGDVILKVNASATPDNFTILFELPTSGNFKIDSQGFISVARELDRETLDGYSLLVMASKDGTQAIGYVSITVVDVNDEKPEFQFGTYKGQIKENSPPGSSVIEVKAVDKDEQDVISYTIMAGNTDDVFNISSSGEILIAKQPDHETTAFFNLTVVASDGVNSGITFVEITILDINDNSPVFANSSYSLSLPEDTPGGASVLQVSARDDDDGDDGIIVYSISGGDGRFAIDSLTGVISTTDKFLDFESTTQYALNVSATDRGGLKASVLVIINITDSNDHTPEFSSPSYNVTIAENYFGALTSLHLNASDLDSGRNSKLTYSIVDGPSFFTINPKTGELNASVPVDRDASGTPNDKYCRGVFFLTIQVSDNGTTKLTDTAKVTVLVTDVNDNAPSFSRTSYEVEISVVDIGNIFRIMASDSDCDVNNKIEYSFTSDNGSSLFQVNTTTGNITVIKPLNGSQGVYFLNVTATNALASPKLRSSVLVTITVLENRNYAPVFDKDQYSFNVSEGAEIGVTIGSVSASDLNKGKDGVFIYSIENPGYAIPFDIDPTSGVITLVRKLDRETHKNYTLVVVAQDFGDPVLRDTTLVFISLDDINDEIPKFEQDEQKFSVAENITVGSLVGKVTAIDEDADMYGEPIYIIHSGNEAGHFRIDNSTGNIYLVKSLDREVIHIFELIIYAYNHGSSIARRRRDTGVNYDVLKVVIEVTDINDNPPEFTLTNYIAGFKISDPPGTNVTKIQATDKDEGSNSNIIYSIKSGNDAGAFAIDPATGLISTTENITQLEEVFKVILTVVAQDSADQGTPKEATVTIYQIPERDPLELKVSSDLDEDAIRELLRNITGPDYDIIIQEINTGGPLSTVKYYVIKKDGDFLTEQEMRNLIIAYCEVNEEICERWGINLEFQNGNTSALLGEDDITILEACLITLGVIVGIGGLLGIFLLCCLRRRKRYMPVYESTGYIMSSKAVSFDERPHIYQPNIGDEANRVSTFSAQESQEVEIHMDEEGSSLDSAEEMRPGSCSSAEIEKEEAIAKVQAYMNQALMDDDDSDTDSSEDENGETSATPRVDGDSSTGSTEPLVHSYTITNL